jgi:hypothetical protein
MPQVAAKIAAQDLPRRVAHAYATMDTPWPWWDKREPTPERWAAMDIVCMERDRRLSLTLPKVGVHLVSEAEFRQALWEGAARLHLSPDVYQEARQRLHAGPLESFQRDAAKQPVVILDGVEMGLQEAVQRAVKPAPPRIVVPELPAPTPAPAPVQEAAPRPATVAAVPPPPAQEEPEEPLYRKIKRIPGWTPGDPTGAADFLARQEAREQPAKAPGRPPEPSKPGQGPDTPNDTPSIKRSHP